MVSASFADLCSDWLLHWHLASAPTATRFNSYTRVPGPQSRPGLLAPSPTVRPAQKCFKFHWAENRRNILKIVACCGSCATAGKGQRQVRPAWGYDIPEV
jgi:hypothetical protein